MSEYSDTGLSEAEEVLEEVDVASVYTADDGEDLIHDHMEEDYLRNPEDDVYDPTMLDDTDQAPISHQARMRAEAEMKERDNIEREMNDRYRNQPLYNMLRVLDFNEETNENTAETQGVPTQQRVQRYRRVQSSIASKLSSPSANDVQTAKDELPYCVKGRSWDPRMTELFKVLFHDFIVNYTDSEEYTGIYLYKLMQIIQNDKYSIEIKFDHLVNYQTKLTDWIVNHPIEVLQIFDDVVTKDIIHKLFSWLYRDAGVRVRLTGFNDFIEQISDLKVESLNQLLGTEGVVLRKGGVYARIQDFFIECVRCKEVSGPLDIKQNSLKSFRQKFICPRESCSSNGPFVMNRENMKYKSVQHITIQEMSNSIQPGRIPRQKDVVIDGDLVDTVRPGDEVQVFGYHEHKRVTELNARTGFPIVQTQLLANNIIKKSDIIKSEITEEDIDLFHKLARAPNIRDRIINSIAPSIWGHKHAKTAIAMSVFGGVRKDGDSNNKHSIRGDINVLLLGDPGVAKSQFLKYVNGLVEKSVYTTGKGASATGLTASMKKDPSTGEYILEGGALVLADNGICLIDEFDKMSEHDRVSIHEAMECQTISISKAGICTSLRARCSVIAAANPIYGRYDSSLSFNENVSLGDTILSRFDVLAVMKNTPTIVYDEYLASYVLNMHKTSHPDVLLQKNYGLDFNNIEESLDHANILTGKGPLPQSILSRYISYARANVHPVISEAFHNKVSEFYAQVRQASKSAGGLSLTVRHLESILRMAFANAKMRLSNVVDKNDVDFAIGTLLESFIQSQKCAVATSLSQRFGRYRALANSPFDVLEGLIGDLMTKRINSVISTALLKEDRSKLDMRDLDLFDQSVSKEVLAGLAKSLFGINDAFLEKYLDSNRFKNKFITRTYDGKVHIMTKMFNEDNINIGYIPETQVQDVLQPTQEIV